MTISIKSKMGSTLTALSLYKVGVGYSTKPTQSRVEPNKHVLKFSRADALEGSVLFTWLCTCHVLPPAPPILRKKKNRHGPLVGTLHDMTACNPTNLTWFPTTPAGQQNAFSSGCFFIRKGKETKKTRFKVEAPWYTRKTFLNMPSFLATRVELYRRKCLHKI